jgi:hypothetical protein
MNREIYADKANRDKRYKELVAKYGKDRVYRERSTGQQLHPMYVQDRCQDLSAADKGFGNTIYKTYFPVLYIVGVRD